VGIIEIDPWKEKEKAMTIKLPDARTLSDQELEVLRLRALQGIELGYTQEQLAEILGVCRESISFWWTSYKRGGLDALPGPRSGRPLGSGRFLSDEQSKHICRLLDKHLPEDLGIASALWTRRAVQALILKVCKVRLALRTVGKYLARWGYTSKKPARHARNQDPQQVKTFMEKTYPAIEKQAEKEDAEILFADETATKADHHPGYSYARRGQRAKMAVPRPHIRVNQISALGVEGTVAFMTYTKSFSEAVFIQFLEQLIKDAKKKILLIVDQLPAHKTEAVAEWIEQHKDKIEVFYLSTYSPELNPVEYMNNHMKAEVNKAGLPDDRPTLLSRIVAFMGDLAKAPHKVLSYFQHPAVQYTHAGVG
jgi:transposase